MSARGIDLTGISDLWCKPGEPDVCADCKRHFDREDPHEESGLNDGSEASVPLILWKDNGRLMLTLCGKCADKRSLTRRAAQTSSQPNPEL